MKRCIYITLGLLLSVSLLQNVFFFVKSNVEEEKYIANNVIEILRSASELKENLQRLVNRNAGWSESNMMYVINGQFGNLSSLMRANRSITSVAVSDFEYIAATFIGPGATNQFETVGIYDDLKITQNEYEYFTYLIRLLDKLGENVAISNVKYDLDVLNSNLQYIHEQLYDFRNSPYLLIS